MASVSSKYRRKLKEENPEAYRKYLDKQKQISKRNRDKLKQLLLENPTDELKRKREKQLESAKERKRKWLERKNERKGTKRRKKRTSKQAQEDARPEDCADQDGITTQFVDPLDNNTDNADEKSRPENDDDQEPDSFAFAEKNIDHSTESDKGNSRNVFIVQTEEDDTAPSNAPQENGFEVTPLLGPMPPPCLTTSKGNTTNATMDEFVHITSSRRILDNYPDMTPEAVHDIVDGPMNGSEGQVTHENTRDEDFSQNSIQNQEGNSGLSNKYEANQLRLENNPLSVQGNTENIIYRHNSRNEPLSATQSTFQENRPIGERMVINPDAFNSNGSLHSRPLFPLTPGYMQFRPTVLTQLDNGNTTHSNGLDGLLLQPTNPPSSYRQNVSGFQQHTNQYADLSQWPDLQSDRNALSTSRLISGAEPMQMSPFVLDERGDHWSQIPVTSDLNMHLNGNSMSGTFKTPSHLLDPVNLSFNGVQRNDSRLSTLSARDITEPNSRPAPYTRFIDQQETQSSSSIIERHRVSTTCQHHREPKNIACIDCDRKLICRRCAPYHCRHRLTVFKMLENTISKTREVELPSDFILTRMFSIRESLYFGKHMEKTLMCYNIVDKTMRTIHLTCDDGDRIYYTCLSPDREEFWYCTEKGSVYQMRVRDEYCVLKFNHLIVRYYRICVTQGNRVLLSVHTRDYLDEQDDIDSGDTDSDEGDTECHYIMIYTATGQLQSRHFIERKTGVYIDCFGECSITGDILITIYNRNSKRSKLLLTDEKMNRKYEISGKSVRYHTGGRKKKRTGYSCSWSIIGDACFDAEGNILLSLDNCDVILMDHDTGMYIRTVYTSCRVSVITVQEDDELWCFDGGRITGKRKLSSVKYLEKL